MGRDSLSRDKRMVSKRTQHNKLDNAARLSYSLPAKRGDSMAIAVKFAPKSMSTAKYDECIKRLEEAGAGAPKGRLYHACYGNSEDLRVFDVWESNELFEEFGQTLMPILQKLNIDPGQPEISEIHNIIVG